MSPPKAQHVRLPIGGFFHMFLRLGGTLILKVCLARSPVEHTQTPYRLRQTENGNTPKTHRKMVHHLLVSNEITWAGVKPSLKFIALFVRYVKRIKGYIAEQVPLHQILDAIPFNGQTKQQPDSRNNCSSNTVSDTHSQELNLTFAKLKLNNFKVIVALNSTKIFTLRSKVTVFWRALIPNLNSSALIQRWLLRLFPRNHFLSQNKVLISRRKLPFPIIHTWPAGLQHIARELQDVL